MQRITTCWRYSARYCVTACITDFKVFYVWIGHLQGIAGFLVGQQIYLKKLEVQDIQNLPKEEIYTK